MSGYDPRSIAFISEIVHPPMAHQPPLLQKLFTDLCEAHPSWYQNFTLVPGGATVQSANAAPGQVSAASFLQDRLQVREEMTSLTLDEFLEKVEAVARGSLARLGIPVLTAEQCVVRALVSPRSFQDSREFLMQGMLRFPPERWEPLGREMNMLGLRLVFPGTQADPSLYNVRIESYAGDVRSLFLEVSGVFPGVITAPQLGVLSEHFRRAYTFLQQNVCGFLAGFDAREL